jgi:ParB family chromosome partitioning protein
MTLAVVNYAKTGTKLTFTKAVPDDFVNYLLRRIAGLHEDYLGESQKARRNQTK